MNQTMKTMLLPMGLNPMPRLVAASEAAAVALPNPFLRSAREKTHSRADDVAPVRAQPLTRSNLRAAQRWEAVVYSLIALCAAAPLVGGLISTGGFAAGFERLVAWVRYYGL